MGGWWHWTSWRIYIFLWKGEWEVQVRIYKTIILPVILYGCETWSLTLMEEHKLREFENRMLRIFGPKRDGATGG
jgi:hypothetical protein